jgi:hypothetical protein
MDPPKEPEDGINGTGDAVVRRGPRRLRGASYAPLGFHRTQNERTGHEPPDLSRRCGTIHFSRGGRAGQEMRAGSARKLQQQRELTGAIAASDKVERKTAEREDQNERKTHAPNLGLGGRGRGKPPTALLVHRSIYYTAERRHENHLARRNGGVPVAAWPCSCAHCIAYERFLQVRTYFARPYLSAHCTYLHHVNISSVGYQIAIADAQRSACCWRLIRRYRCTVCLHVPET